MAKLSVKNGQQAAILDGVQSIILNACKLGGFAPCRFERSEFAVQLLFAVTTFFHQ